MDRSEGILRTVKANWQDLTDAHDIVVYPLNNIVSEPVYQRAISKGSKVQWTTDQKVRSMLQRGWKPLVTHDDTGRISVFVDSKRAVVALTKDRT